MSSLVDGFYALRPGVGLSTWTPFDVVSPGAMAVAARSRRDTADGLPVHLALRGDGPRGTPGGRGGGVLRPAVGGHRRPAVDLGAVWDPNVFAVGRVPNGGQRSTRCCLRSFNQESLLRCRTSAEALISAEVCAERDLGSLGPR